MSSLSQKINNKIEREEKKEKGWKKERERRGRIILRKKAIGEVSMDSKTYYKVTVLKLKLKQYLGKDTHRDRPELRIQK